MKKLQAMLFICFFLVGSTVSLASGYVSNGTLELETPNTVYITPFSEMIILKGFVRSGNSGNVIVEVSGNSIGPYQEMGQYSLSAINNSSDWKIEVPRGYSQVFVRAKLGAIITPPVTVNVLNGSVQKKQLNAADWTSIN